MKDFPRGDQWSPVAINMKNRMTQGRNVYKSLGVGFNFGSVRRAITDRPYSDKIFLRVFTMIFASAICDGGCDAIDSGSREIRICYCFFVA